MSSVSCRQATRCGPIEAQTADCRMLEASRLTPHFNYFADLGMAALDAQSNGKLTGPARDCLWE